MKKSYLVLAMLIITALVGRFFDFAIFIAFLYLLFGDD